MTISRTHKIILFAAVIIALIITGISFLQQQHRPHLTYSCFKTAEGWGYDILINKKIIIHQPVIPGIPGKTGFATAQQAQAVAQIVIEKVKSGHAPIITPALLQQLNIL